MTEVISLLLVALVALALVGLGWWLLIASEGVYLGRWVVIWLYDRFANRYDDVKAFTSVYEHALLAQPIMEKIAPHQAPLVLDVATGTARLPLALLKHQHFQGRVIGVDLSRHMLRNAAQKVGNQAGLIWCPAERLPFADSMFDVVTSLESLEFMMNPAAALQEMVRVLRPGGLLLVSNRINTKLMPGKTWNRERLAALLVDCAIAEADIEPWQVDYQRVWAIKGGDASPSGARPLGEILRCPCCPASLMVEQSGKWTCEMCAGEAPVGKDGVIELFPLQEQCRK